MDSVQDEFRQNPNLAAARALAEISSGTTEAAGDAESDTTGTAVAESGEIALDPSQLTDVPEGSTVYTVVDPNSGEQQTVIVPPGYQLVQADNGEMQIISNETLATASTIQDEGATVSTEAPITEEATKSTEEENTQAEETVTNIQTETPKSKPQTQTKHSEAATVTTGSETVTSTAKEPQKATEVPRPPPKQEQQFAQNLEALFRSVLSDSSAEKVGSKQEKSSVGESHELDTMVNELERMLSDANGTSGANKAETAKQTATSEQTESAQTSASEQQSVEEMLSGATAVVVDKTQMELVQLPNGALLSLDGIEHGSTLYVTGNSEVYAVDQSGNLVTLVGASSAAEQAQATSEPVKQSAEPVAPVAEQPQTQTPAAPSQESAVPTSVGTVPEQQQQQQQTTTAAAADDLYYVLLENGSAAPITAQQLAQLQSQGVNFQFSDAQTPQGWAKGRLAIPLSVGAKTASAVTVEPNTAHQVGSAQERLRREKRNQTFTQMNRRVDNVVKMRSGFGCTCCDFESKYIRDIERHVKSKHTTIRPYTCSSCGFEGPDKMDVMTHVADEHPGLTVDVYEDQVLNTELQNISRGLYKCEIRKVCEFEQLREHPGMEIKEQASGTVVDYVSPGRDGYRGMNTIEVMVCKQCPYTTDHSINMAAHVLSVHLTNCFRAYQCPYCEFDSYDESAVLRHSTILHKNKPLGVMINKSLDAAAEREVQRCFVRQAPKSFPAGRAPADYAQKGRYAYQGGRPTTTLLHRSSIVSQQNTVSSLGTSMGGSGSPPRRAGFIETEPEIVRRSTREDRPIRAGELEDEDELALIDTGDGEKICIYHCNMCEQNKDYFSKQAIVKHIKTTHLPKPFRCAMCLVDGCTKSFVMQHFVRKHPGHDIQVVTDKTKLKLLMDSDYSDYYTLEEKSVTTTITKSAAQRKSSPVGEEQKQLKQTMTSLGVLDKIKKRKYICYVQSCFYSAPYPTDMARHMIKFHRITDWTPEDHLSRGGKYTDDYTDSDNESEDEPKSKRAAAAKSNEADEDLDDDLTEELLSGSSEDKSGETTDNKTAYRQWKAELGGCNQGDYMYFCRMNGCEFRTRILNNMKRHVITLHTLYRPYICGVCPSEFSNEFELVRHLHCRHGVRHDYKDYMSVNLTLLNEIENDLITHLAKCSNANTGEFLEEFVTDADIPLANEFAEIPFETVDLVDASASLRKDTSVDLEPPAVKQSPETEKAEVEKPAEDTIVKDGTEIKDDTSVDTKDVDSGKQDEMKEQEGLVSADPAWLKEKQEESMVGGNQQQTPSASENIEDESQLQIDQNSMGAVDEDTGGKKPFQPPPPVITDVSGLKMVAKYACLKCEYVTVMRVTMLNHAMRHSNLKPYKCTICNLDTAVRKDAIKHAIREHGKSSAEHCIVCDEELLQEGEHFATRNMAKFHCLDTRHPSAQESTDTSHVSSPKKASNEQQPPKKRGRKPGSTNKHDVQDQGYTTTAEDYVSLKSYVGDQNMQGGYRCRLCPYASNMLRFIEQHVMMEHCKIKPFSCKYCKQGFAVESNLKQHIRTEHPGASVQIGILTDHNGLAKLQSVAAKCYSTDDERDKEADFSNIDHETVDKYLSALGLNRQEVSSSAMGTESTTTREEQPLLQFPQTIATALPKRPATQEQDTDVATKRAKVIDSGAKAASKELVAPLPNVTTTYFCKLCPYKSQIQAAIDRHVKMAHCHEYDKPFSCERCDYLAIDYLEVSKHSRKMHVGEEVAVVTNEYAKTVLEGAAAELYSKEESELVRGHEFLDYPVQTTESTAAPTDTAPFSTGLGVGPEGEEAEDEAIGLSDLYQHEFDELHDDPDYVPPAGSAADESFQEEDSAKDDSADDGEATEKQTEGVVEGKEEEETPDTSGVNGHDVDSETLSSETHGSSASVESANQGKSSTVADVEEAVSTQQTEHQTGTFQCLSCNYITSKGRYDMLKHLCVKHVPREKLPFLCKKCGFRAPDPNRVVVHVKDHHPDQDSSLVTCDQVLYNELRDKARTMCKMLK